MLNITDNGNWPFILINWEEKKVSQQEIQKITSWYSYNEITWLFEETEESKNIEKQKLQNELESVTNDLVNVNWKIEWAKKLQAMQIFDADDELDLIWYETKAQELIITRSEIKAKIKELWN